MKRVWGGQKRWLALVAVALLVGLGLVGWVERSTLRAWWVLRGLRQADGAEVGVWAERVADLGEPALPALLDWLAEAAEPDVARAEAVLLALSRRWGAEDPRHEELAQRLVKAFPRLPPAGQCAALNAARVWLEAGPACPERLATQAGRLLVEASRQADPGVLNSALQLAGPLLERGADAEARCAARALARQGLRATDPAVRLRGAELAGKPGMDLAEAVVPLLNDPCPEVRRAALQAVGPVGKALPTDSLLPWLHDPDDGVRLLCERALRQRGLNSDYIRLARLITDANWAARLEVLDHLDEAAELDLDPVVWLRRLTHDPAPAVRVAAIRAASEAHLRQLADRLDQMARDDPSPTVSELARHYQRPLDGQRP